MSRRPKLHLFHSTSEPLRFVGRSEELATLDRALTDGQLSVIALIGPGGQGKTALVRHWLDVLAAQETEVQGIFFWSFYRGKDSDLFLRQLYACVANLPHLPDLSATYCVEQLLRLLHEQAWVIALDGTEVVQHETGDWYGRFLHPEVSRLLQEIASAPHRGVVLLTSRFPLPDLERRPHGQLISLERLPIDVAVRLLASLGVQGESAELQRVAEASGCHAKAVELLGTMLVRFADRQAHRLGELVPISAEEMHWDDEQRVARVLAAFNKVLSQEAQDILTLATAFREPPTNAAFLSYLCSQPVKKLLHQIWKRVYKPFEERSKDWLVAQIEALIELRLLERVSSTGGTVLDAHPLVRRAFERVRSEQPAAAQTRADFLRGRPDRRPPTSLAEAQPEIELFHAYAEGGLWREADQVLAFLDRPRYRFLAPALEQDLLVQFFPNHDWRQPPLWSPFSRHRDLAICLEMQGRFEEAVPLYRGEHWPLAGDALLALGKLELFLTDEPPPRPWQMLWQAYQAHALCLAGRVQEALRLCMRLVPQDIYEWHHVFEALLRAGRLDAIDMNSFLYRPPSAIDPLWNKLARERMRTDYLRILGLANCESLTKAFEDLLEAYDRSGLPVERVLTRLSYARHLLKEKHSIQAQRLIAEAGEMARRHHMSILEADCWELASEAYRAGDDLLVADEHARQAGVIRGRIGYRGPTRL